MSDQGRVRETGETRATRGTGPPVAEGRAPALDLIACNGCGRRFATEDGPGMIAAIEGPCPDCGGRFELLGPSSEDLPD